MIFKEIIKNGIGNLINDQELSLKVKEYMKFHLIEMANEQWLNGIIKELGLTLAQELCNNTSLRDELATMFISLFNREDITTELAKMFSDIVRRDDIRDEINILVKNVCADANNKEEVAKSLKDIVSRDDVKKQLGNTARGSLYNVFFGWW